jgi:hypothetical protein
VNEYDGIDRHAARFEHTGVAIAAALAYWARAPLLVTVTFLTVGAAAVLGRPGSVFSWVYDRFIRQAVGPNPSGFEEEEAHRFAMLLNALVLVGAVVALGFGWSAAGWAFTLVVAVTATLAAIGWCAGCALYRVVQR